MSEFSEAIVAFNHMYKLPVEEVPTIISAQRLINFKSILKKELDEIDDILAKWNGQEVLSKAELLTDIADLLGDIQVYCASEMAKWGLPLDQTLSIIMESNMSKLGADGLPIYDAEGKVQKGPNYWKPEPRIAQMIQGRLQAHADKVAEESAAPAAAEKSPFKELVK